MTAHVKEALTRRAHRSSDVTRVGGGAGLPPGRAVATPARSAQRPERCRPARTSPVSPIRCGLSCWLTVTGCSVPCTMPKTRAQETLVRAWRSYGDFEGRASLRTWLYRIATNTCLRALENRSRRPLPGLGGPADDPDGPLDPARPEVPWLKPFPDAAARR